MSSFLKQHLMHTVNYNKWAYTQINAICNRHHSKNPDFYTKPMDLPSRSIRNSLCKCWILEQLWFCRIIGGTHRDLKLPYTIPRTIDMQEFGTYWTPKHEYHGKFDLFFEGISDELLFTALSKSADNWIEFVQVQNDDEELTQQFTYFDTNNKKTSSCNDIVVEHVVQHSSQVRAQIVGAVTAFDPKAVPPPFDFMHWHKLQEQQLNLQVMG